MVPLVVLTIIFGFYPAPILDATAASVNLLVTNIANVAGTVVADAPAAVVAH
jgi:NADH-quinone oxidoreductase subunit M